MAMVVQHNAAAQLALGELNKNVSKVGDLLAKVSSGQKINSAKDDSASFCISEKMREQIRSLLQDNQNVQNGSALFKTAEGGINNIVEELRNLKELAINAANDTNTDADRATIQKEFTQKMANINDIATVTNYNGIRLLDGTWNKTITSAIIGYQTVKDPVLVPNDKVKNMESSFHATDSTYTGGNSRTTPPSTPRTNVKVDVAFTAKDSSWNWASEYEKNNFTTVPSDSTSTIQTFLRYLDISGSTIDRSSALYNKAINAATGGTYETASDLTNQFLSDFDNYMNTAGNTWTGFLQDYCNIDLTNADTGAITGYDFDNSNPVKNAQDIVPENNVVSSWGSPTPGGSDVINGLTINWPSSGTNGSTFTAAEDFILRGLNSDWISNCITLIQDSFDMNFSEAGTTVSAIDVKFENDPSSNALAYVTSGSVAGKTQELSLTINMGYYGNISTTDENGDSQNPNAGYLDRTLAHEFTHAVMSANINNFAGLPNYIQEGMAELVHGIDDERQYSITNLQRSDFVETFNGTASGETPYSAGYIFLRYLAKLGENGNFNLQDQFLSADNYYLNTGQMGVNLDFTGLVDANDNAITVADLDQQSFSVVCGACYQYINFTFDTSLTPQQSTFSRDTEDSYRSGYVIGLSGVTSLSDVPEAIFTGIYNSATLEDRQGRYPYDDVYVKNQESDTADDTNLLSVVVDGAHSVSIAKDPSDPTKFLFLKTTSPSLGIVTGMIDGEITYEVPIMGETRRLNPLKIHHGPKANQHTNFFINDMHTKSLGTKDLLDENGMPKNESDLARYDALSYDENLQSAWLETLDLAQNKSLDDISVTTKKNANVAIRVLDGAIDVAIDEATRIGSYLQRLDYTDANVTTMGENIQAAESTIRDADMAKEMTEYTKFNVLQQSAQAMLAQANQNGSAVLSLLQ